MASRRTIGEAYVTIMPEGSGFRARAKIVIDKALAGLEGDVRLGIDDKALATKARSAAVKAQAAVAKGIKVPVELRSDRLKRDIVAVSSQVRALSGQSVQIRAEMNDRKFNAEALALEAKVRALTDKSIHIKTFTDLARVRADAARLALAMDDLRLKASRALDEEARKAEKAAVATRAAADAAQRLADKQKVAAADLALAETSFMRLNRQAGAYRMEIDKLINATSHFSAKQIVRGDHTAELKALNRALAETFREMEAIRAKGSITTATDVARIDALKRRMDALNRAILENGIIVQGTKTRWRGWINMLLDIGRKEIPLFGGALRGLVPHFLSVTNGMHLMIDAAVEILATWVPAAVAVTIFGAAAAKASIAVYKNVKNMNTATQATGKHFAVMGKIGSGALSMLAKPYVYQAFGLGMIAMQKQSTQTGTVVGMVGRTIDKWAAEATTAYLGSTGKMAILGAKDFQKIGDSFHALGSVFNTFLKSVPGYAEILLSTGTRILQIFADVVRVLQPVIGILLAAHGAFLYLGVAITAVKWILGLLARPIIVVIAFLRSMSLAAAGAAGPWNKMTAAMRAAALEMQGRVSKGAGAVKVALAGLPASAGATTRAMTAMRTGAGSALSGLGSAAAKAGGAVKNGFMKVMNNLGVNPWVGGIALVGGAFGFLVYKMLSAKNAAQQFGDAANKAISASTVRTFGDVIATQLTAAKVAYLNAGQAAQAYGKQIDIQHIAASYQARDAANVANGYAGQAVHLQVLTQLQKDWGSVLTDIQGKSARFSQHLGAVASSLGNGPGGVAGAMTLVEKSGVSMDDFVSKDTKTWLQAQLQVEATARGYQAMTAQVGGLNTALNALNIQDSAQLKAATDLEGAYSNFLGIITGGTQNLGTFSQGMATLNQNLGNGGANFAKISLDKLKGSISGTTTASAQATAKVAGMNAQVAALQQQVSSTRATMLAHGATTKQVTTATSGLTGQIASLRTQMAGVRSSAASANAASMGVKVSLDGTSTASMAAAQAFATQVTNAGTLYNSLLSLATVSGNSAQAQGALARAGKDMVAQLLPVASTSKTATTQVYALAQIAGYTGDNSLKGLVKWLGNTKGSMTDLKVQTDLLTQSAGNLAGDAKALADNLNNNLNAALSQSIINAYGGTAALTAAGKAILAFQGDASAANFASMQSSLKTTANLMLQTAGSTAQAKDQFVTWAAHFGVGRAEAAKWFDALTSVNQVTQQNAAVSQISNKKLNAFAAALHIGADKANKLWSALANQKLDFIGAKAKASHDKFMTWAAAAGISTADAQKLWDKIAAQNIGEWLAGKIGISLDAFKKLTDRKSGLGLTIAQTDNLWNTIGAQKFDFLSGKADTNRAAFEKLAHMYGITTGDADTLWKELRDKEALSYITGKSVKTRGEFDQLVAKMGVTQGEAKNLWDELLKAPNVTASVKVNLAASGTITAAANTAAKAGQAVFKLFARGGQVPGYAPGSDTVPAMLSPGEYVLNPTAARAIGTRNLDAINSSARPGGGQATMKNGMQGFVNGGQVLADAVKWNGHPYHWGGPSNPQGGWDCCLAPESVVQTTCGPKPIIDIRRGDEVYTWDDGKLVPRHVNGRSEPRRQMTYRLRTGTREIEASGNHPFLVLRKTGHSLNPDNPDGRKRRARAWETSWERLDNLRRGDVIVQMRHAPDDELNASDGLLGDSRFLWLLGAMLGDGHGSPQRANRVYLCMFGEQREQAQKYIEELTGHRATEHDRHGMYFHDEWLAAAFREYGALDVPHHEIRVPRDIWSLPHEQVRAFLAGYHTADGSGTPGKTLSYHSTSRGMLDDAHNLHMILGDAVHPVREFKRSGKPIVIKGKTVRSVRKIWVLTCNPDSGWAGTRELQEQGIRAFFPEGSNFRPESVLSIEPLRERDTYDIEVEGTHNFVANGLVVHNSSFVGYILGHDFGLPLPGGVQWNANVHGPVASQYNNEPGFNLASHNVNDIQPGDLLVENSGGHVGFGVGPNRMFSAYGTASGTIFSDAANMTNIYRSSGGGAVANIAGILSGAFTGAGSIVLDVASAIKSGIGAITGSKLLGGSGGSGVLAKLSGKGVMSAANVAGVGKTVDSAPPSVAAGAANFAKSTSENFTATLVNSLASAAKASQAAMSAGAFGGNPGPGGPVGSLGGATSGGGLANLVTIAKYLISQGVSKAAAAGIAGTIAGEAVPMGSPESRGSGGWGLIGWTGNTIGLPAGYTGPTGNFATDMAAQLQGIVGYGKAVGPWSQLISMSDPVAAGNLWSSAFEKPAVSLSDTRPAIARQLFSMGLANGGQVPGYAPGSDTVPAMLSPGEFVINPESAKAIGYDNLHALNSQKLAKGGKVKPPTLSQLKAQEKALRSKIAVVVKQQHADESHGNAKAFFDDTVSLNSLNAQLGKVTGQEAALTGKATAAKVNAGKSPLQKAIDQANSVIASVTKQEAATSGVISAAFKAKDLAYYLSCSQERVKLDGALAVLRARETAAQSTASAASYRTSLDPVGKVAYFSSGYLPKLADDLMHHSTSPYGVGKLTAPDMHRMALGAPPDLLDAIYSGDYRALSTALKGDAKGMLPLFQRLSHDKAVLPLPVGSDMAGLASASKKAQAVVSQAAAMVAAYNKLHVPKVTSASGSSSGGGTAAAAGAVDSPGPGDAVTRWSNVVRYVLGLEHVNVPVSQVLTQIRSESGGNPRAINLWDSNAKAGDPSRGLLQTIMTTFTANHWPGTSTDIYDPLANVAAAVNYARHRYGPTLMSGGSGLGSGHGYAVGGTIAEKILGVGMSTGRSYSLGENGPERVMPERAMKRYEQGNGQGMTAKQADCMIAELRATRLAVQAADKSNQAGLGGVGRGLR